MIPKDRTRPWHCAKARASVYKPVFTSASYANIENWIAAPLSPEIYEITALTCHALLKMHVSL